VPIKLKPFPRFSASLIPGICWSFSRAINHLKAPSSNRADLYVWPCCVLPDISDMAMKAAKTYANAVNWVRLSSAKCLSKWINFAKLITACQGLRPGCWCLKGMGMGMGCGSGSGSGGVTQHAASTIGAARGTQQENIYTLPHTRSMIIDSRWELGKQVCHFAEQRTNSNWNSNSAPGQRQCQLAAGVAIKSPNYSDFNRFAGLCPTHIHIHIPWTVYSQSGNCEFAERLRREFALRDTGRWDIWGYMAGIEGAEESRTLFSCMCRLNLTRHLHEKLILSRPWLM